MSQANSDNEWDVYTGLLFISAAAMLTACGLLALELSRYGWAVNG